MASADERGKADLRCNDCNHQYRGWVWYSEIWRADPGLHRWGPGEIIGDCPECHSEALSYVQPRTVDYPPAGLGHATGAGNKRAEAPKDPGAGDSGERYR